MWNVCKWPAPQSKLRGSSSLTARLICWSDERLVRRRACTSKEAASDPGSQRGGAGPRPTSSASPSCFSALCCLCPHTSLGNRPASSQVPPPRPPWITWGANLPKPQSPVQNFSGPCCWLCIIYSPVSPVSIMVHATYLLVMNLHNESIISGG